MVYKFRKSLFQFAIVHYFTKYGSGECYFSREDFESSSDSDMDGNDQQLMTHSNQRRNSSNTLPRVNIERDIFEVIPLSMCTLPMRTATTTSRRPVKTQRRSQSSWTNFLSRCHRKTSVHTMPSQLAHDRIYPAPYNSQKTNDQFNENSRVTRNGNQTDLHHDSSRSFDRRSRTPRFNSVSKIDRASRIFFPLVFLLINVFYWYSYLSKSERWIKPHASLPCQ